MLNRSKLNMCSLTKPSYSRILFPLVICSLAFDFLLLGVRSSSDSGSTESIPSLLCHSIHPENSTSLPRCSPSRAAPTLRLHTLKRAWEDGQPLRDFGAILFVYFWILPQIHLHKFVILSFVIELIVKCPMGVFYLKEACS